MRRAIAMILLLVWSGQSFASGFEENPCRQRSLSRMQLKQLKAEVHAATGLQVDDDIYSCSRKGRVSSYLATRHVRDTNGSEHWYEGTCDRDRRRGWDCEFVGQRTLDFSGPWGDAHAKVFISMTADASLARRRLEEAWTLTGTLAEQNHCSPPEAAVPQLLELRSDLSAPFYQLQIAMEGERFTLWTLRYAIHFTADAPESVLQLRCWRARKSPLECMSSKCPA
jgi:hypothetical protein